MKMKKVMALVLSLSMAMGVLTGCGSRSIAFIMTMGCGSPEWGMWCSVPIAEVLESAGMQTLWLAALDERIRRAVISGYLYGYKDSLLYLNGNCSCNYVPHLWEHFDMGDIASLIAPRELVIQSCREDDLNGPRGLDNVYEQMEIIYRAYELYGRREAVVHDIREGGHCFHPEVLERFRK